MPAVKNYTFLIFATLMLAGALTGPSAYARTVHIPLPGGIDASAEYRRGDADKPAVLILHGFLQTRAFPTVANLADALADSGYATLTPTLSLGISNRQRSLACEAVHTHSMEQDVAEVHAWVEWLRSTGHRKIVLVGHSYGSLQLFIYNMREANDAVTRVIAISLVDLEHAVGTERLQQQIAEARALSEQNNNELRYFKVSHCKRYAAPPFAFLSYAAWDKKQILEGLAKQRRPLLIIMGGADRRMDSEWPAMLQAAGSEVNIIQGANHFFGSEHEFDLADRVLTSLRGITAD